MEFDLHIITSVNRANISMEYDNKESIDKEKLKYVAKEFFNESAVCIKEENVMKENIILYQD